MPFDAFFQDIDGAWPDDGAAPIPLRLIGSTALMLQTDYHRGTNDSDVFETTDLVRETKEGLVQLAGKGTPLHGGIKSTSISFRTECHFSRETLAGIRRQN